MPIDLSALGESLRQGFGEIPPVAIALALLAGPTAMLIGYRLISAARRLPAAANPEAAPYWVCQDCRSINELRATHCYHCSLDRDRTPEIEVIVDVPAVAPSTFAVPAGSPFAALGGMTDRAGTPPAGPGVPVMADADSWSTGVPVGPGHPEPVVAVPVVAEAGESLMLSDVPPMATAGDGGAPAAERHA